VQAFNLPGNTWCLVDINKVLSALPGTQRIGFMGRATMDFSSTVQGYLELGLSRNETEQTFTPPFFAGTTGLQPTSAGLRPFTYNVTFAPGVAGNPLGTNARFTGNLYALGTRNLEITSDSLRALAGLKYSAFGYDFDSAVGYSNNEIDQKNINRISLSGTSAILGIGTGPQPPVPVSTSATCNLDQPSTTPACRNALVDFPRTAKSELTFVDTKASTETSVVLPGGPVGMALGLEYRNEKIKDSPDLRAASGDILGQGITATDGSRHQSAAYVEFALPLTRALEAQVALRHDRYSDFGSSTNPKVGLKFKPTSDFVLRANWGRGFRAPTLPEISPSVATFFTQVNDGFTGQNGVQISGVFAGNPDLKAERSRSGTLGFVWEPNTSFSFGADVFEINWTDIVGSSSFQSIVNADTASRLAGGPGDPRVIRDLTNPITVPVPGGGTRTAFPVVTVLSNYRNLSETFVRGADFDVRYAARTTLGRFTTRINAAYIDDFREEGEQYAGTNGGSNTYPRWKGTLSQDWEQGALLVRGAINYVSSYYQQLLAGSFFTTPVNPLAQNGTYPLKVPSYATLDLFARYSLTSKLQISASIVNVTDETPPYDPGFSATFLYDFSQYDIRGRQYRVGVSYKF
jgi:iron complex outermembrane receptor protein